jgi:hypothetical protein
MRMLAYLLAITASLYWNTAACIAQQARGPATLENLVNSPEARSTPTAYAAPDSGLKRPAGTVSRPKDGVQHPDLDKAWAVYDAAVAKAADGIRAAMAKQFDAAAAKGDLDAAEKWQTALEKFEKAGDVPADTDTKSAVSTAVADYKKAKEELSKAYDSVVKALTMEKRIAEAKAVRNERAESLSGSADENEGSKPEEGLVWRYTTEQPADNWFKAEYDDRQWREGKAGFGSGDRGDIVRTRWNTPNIWMRREFKQPKGPLDKVVVKCHHDEDVKIYINGVLAASATGYVGEYKSLPLTQAGRGAFRPGKNLVAVHCRQSWGGQFIDLWFASTENDGADAKPLPPTPKQAVVVGRWRRVGNGGIAMCDFRADGTGRVDSHRVVWRQTGPNSFRFDFPDHTEWFMNVVADASTVKGILDNGATVDFLRAE